jgi:hypothetical protein
MNKTYATTITESVNLTETVKKPNPLVRAGRWIKNLFTKKTETAIVASKRGQMKQKTRTLKERAKIAYYRARNTAKNVGRFIATQAKRAWTFVKPALVLTYEAAKVLLVNVVAFFIVTAIGVLLVEGTLALSFIIGETLAGVAAFVVVYCFFTEVVAIAQAVVEKGKVRAALEQADRVIDEGSYAALVTA